MGQMGIMKKPNKASQTLQAIESHWSLVNLVKDNWSWIATVIGLSGVTAWLTWVKQSALLAPWYDKVLLSIFSPLIAAFLFMGIRTFWLAAKRTRREEGAIARGLSISGYTYERGAVVEGGTHSIVEIFGADQVRAGLLFRNCQIKGPGTVALFGCSIDKSEFFALPGQQVIDSRFSGELARTAFQLISCRFENCTFTNVLFIANLADRGPDIYRYKLVALMDDE